MNIHMVHRNVMWINAFLTKDGISNTHSRRQLIVGTNLDFNIHCKLEFGQYVQVHAQGDNTMATRSTGVIELRPTGSDQGVHLFFRLTTGQKIDQKNWTELPTPADVIDRVHKMARRLKAPKGSTFTYFDGNNLGYLFPNDSYYEDFDPLE